jgi:membrane fusion protein, multidrug efflux system
MTETGPAGAEHTSAAETPTGVQANTSARRRFPTRPRRWWLALPGILLVAGGAYVASTRSEDVHGARGTPPGPRSVPVVAAPAQRRDVGVYLTGLGSVTPLNTVVVKSRVDGQLIDVRFKEGDAVHSGDLLAEIDPRPFAVQLTQAEGQLARDQALLENARLDLQRYQVLWSQDSIPRQQLDTQASLVRQYEGAVKNDQGLVDSAKVNLTYCRITAPISGRVGLRLVDPGNIVHAADIGGLVVITQLTPIAVLFSLPEDSIPSVLGRLERGARLPVEAYDREQRQRLAVGALLTIDNQVDPSTGTVRLKAVFPNIDHALFPNQFVNARLRLEVQRGATVVPAAAIQRNPRGAFVYVVTPEGTVAARPVTVAITDGDTVSLGAGVSAGEQVVVDGAERLRDGSRVETQVRSGS